MSTDHALQVMRGFALRPQELQKHHDLILLHLAFFPCLCFSFSLWLPGANLQGGSQLWLGGNQNAQLPTQSRWVSWLAECNNGRGLREDLRRPLKDQEVNIWLTVGCRFAGGMFSVKTYAGRLCPEWLFSWTVSKKRQATNDGLGRRREMRSATIFLVSKGFRTSQLAVQGTTRTELVY